MVDTFYRVTGMLYAASGWEDGEWDCSGSLYFATLEEAQKAADTLFMEGGYGINGYFKASRPVITETDDSWFSPVYDSVEEYLDGSED